MKENTPEEDTYANRQLYPSFIPALGELTSAELSMLLEGITPLRVERRYRVGEPLIRMA